jgi:hypothetical protein
MNLKHFYQSPQADVVILQNEGIMCQSDDDTKYSTSKFEWDEAMDL